MRRALTLFGTSLLLWAVITQLNDALASWRLHVSAGALFLVYAALTQPSASGLAATALAGLVCDAHAPVAFGTHLLLFVATHLIIVRIRHRIPRDDTLSAITVALLANLAIFLVFSLTQLHLALPHPSLLPRLGADLLCSQLFLALAAPWFFALQSQALFLARVPRHDTD